MLTVLAICLGASVGALSRWQLGLWLNPPSALIPWGTLTANWIGAWLIGVAVVFFQNQPDLDPAWRLAIVTGLLGALTTFSTFSVETVSMLQHGRVALALVNATLHLLGSLLLTWAGLRMASHWWTGTP
ncbi:MAG: fluoride efflux transporter CrcB [Burkholderiaceae bacterium]